MYFSIRDRIWAWFCVDVLRAGWKKWIDTGGKDWNAFEQQQLNLWEYFDAMECGMLDLHIERCKKATVVSTGSLVGALCVSSPAGFLQPVLPSQGHVMIAQPTTKTKTRTARGTRTKSTKQSKGKGSKTACCAGVVCGSSVNAAATAASGSNSVPATKKKTPPLVTPVATVAAPTETKPSVPILSANEAPTDTATGESVAATVQTTTTAATVAQVPTATATPPTAVCPVNSTTTTQVTTTTPAMMKTSTTETQTSTTQTAANTQTPTAAPTSEK